MSAKRRLTFAASDAIADVFCTAPAESSMRAAVFSSDADPRSSDATTASRWRSTFSSAGRMPAAIPIVATRTRAPAASPMTPYIVSPTPIARRRRGIISSMHGSYRPTEERT